MERNQQTLWQMVKWFSSISLLFLTSGQQSLFYFLQYKPPSDKE